MQLRSLIIYTSLGLSYFTGSLSKQLDIIGFGVQVMVTNLSMLKWQLHEMTLLESYLLFELGAQGNFAVASHVRSALRALGSEASNESGL